MRGNQILLSIFNFYQILPYGDLTLEKNSYVSLRCELTNYSKNVNEPISEWRMIRIIDAMENVSISVTVTRYQTSKPDITG